MNINRITVVKRDGQMDIIILHSDLTGTTYHGGTADWISYASRDVAEPWVKENFSDVPYTVIEN